jgi:acetyl-CoA carboxylase biotin carboxyl carrier protein
MKQFTEVHSDVSGTLDSFAVENSAMVNPGDVLAVVSEG